MLVDQRLDQTSDRILDQIRQLVSDKELSRDISASQKLAKYHLLMSIFLQIILFWPKTPSCVLAKGPLPYAGPT